MVSGTVTYFDDTVLGCVAVLAGKDSAGKMRYYWYCHTLKGSRQVGKIKAGDRIAQVGATGTGAIGPHLHFEDKSSARNWRASDRKPSW